MFRDLDWGFRGELMAGILFRVQQLIFPDITQN